MATKLTDQSLEELYNRPKITPAAIKAIKTKEDFSQIQPRYCEACCNLACKDYERQYVETSSANVIIIQSHNALPAGFNSAEQEEQNWSSILSFVMRKCFGEVSHRVVNVIKCTPTFKALGKKAQPTESTMLRCSPYALEEIEQAKPKVIICMSTPGLKMLGIQASIFNQRGEIHEYKGIPVVITLHPSYTTMIRQSASGKMWGPDYLEVLFRDFNKAKKLMRGQLSVPDLDAAIEHYKSQITIAQSSEQVEEIADFLKQYHDNNPSKIISWDLETTSLDPWANNAKIITCQFGYRRDDGKVQAVVIPLWHRENTEVDPYRAWEAIKSILEDSTFMKTGHNLKFDMLYTRVVQGVKVEGVTFDTMLQLHDMNSGIPGNYGLKRAVWDFLPHTGLGGYEDRLPKLDRK